MILELNQHFEVIGSRLDFDEQLQWQDVEWSGSNPFQTPLHVVGTIENRAGIVMMEVSVDFTMTLNCDRCLEPFTVEYSYEFSHILVTETANDNDEYIVLPDRLLSLDEVLEADILLNLPSKLLCKEDCKGLCAICGQNKNLKDCECKEKLGDPRFAVLDQLLK